MTTFFLYNYPQFFLYNFQCLCVSHLTTKLSFDAITFFLIDNDFFFDRGEERKRKKHELIMLTYTSGYFSFFISIIKHFMLRDLILMEIVETFKCFTIEFFYNHY